MRQLSEQTRSHAQGFTLAEVMIGMAIVSVVMAAALTGASSITGTMVTAENYSVGQLATVDYLTLDLRRAYTDFLPTQVGAKLTLPVTLGLPSYYDATGKVPNPPQKTLVTTTNKRKDRKKHRVISSRYYYHYGTLGSSVPVTYSLGRDNKLYRKEGTRPAVAIGENIADVEFTSPDIDLATTPNPTAAQKLDAINTNPVVQTTVSFLATRRSKTAPLPLSNSTFLREYYYSDY